MGMVAGAGAAARPGTPCASMRQARRLLGIVQLLLLAQCVGLPFYSIDLLIGLQTAQLLIIALLIELLLDFGRLWLLGLRHGGLIPFSLVEFLLGSLELLVTF